jgi:hypothetical protein
MKHRFPGCFRNAGILFYVVKLHTFPTVPGETENGNNIYDLFKYLIDKLLNAIILPASDVFKPLAFNMLCPAQVDF